MAPFGENQFGFMSGGNKFFQQVPLMKKRILETIRQGLIGGGETHLLSLVENIDRTCFEPVVLSFTDGPMVDRAKAMGLETKVIPTQRPFDIFAWGKVRDFIKKSDIDIIHAHGTRAASNTLKPARSLGLPFIYTVHGWSFHDDQHPLIKRIRIWGEQWITTRSDVNISVSESNQQTGRNYFGSFDSVVIPNGIDLQKFNPDRPLKDIRKEIGIPGDSILVLFMARFTHHKQPQMVLRGFYEASLQVPALRLLMVGEGDAKPETVEMVSRLGIRDKVYFQDFRMDTPDVLAASDIFVLASLWEGLAISLLEAMSMGKAVVASRVDGNTEVVRHMENGWLVGLEGLEKNLAEALVAISRDPGLREKFGKNARATIDTRYNAVTMTRQTEEIYHTLGRVNKNV
jgi:glycosyltransferase involved in cell wall biosynthesis